jgi:cytoskeletal protein CcmA (bactofilin family)
MGTFLTPHRHTWEGIMFGKKEQIEIKTLIAQGTRIGGDLKFEHGLRVDGEVHGAIHAVSEGSLVVISEGAVAEGGITADRMIISGTVRGPVHARESLNLLATARIEGDVEYAGLEIQQGAIVSGQLRPMGAEASSEVDKPSIRLAARSA